MNTIKFNWKTDEFEVFDVKGYRFSVDDRGGAKIQKPVVAVPLLIRKFGPLEIQKRLSENPIIQSIGNSPRLFCVLPNMQGGFELLKDSDIQKNYVNFPKKNNHNYDISSGKNSLSLSTILPSKILSSNPVYVYRTLERLNSLSSEEESSLRRDKALFDEKVNSRLFVPDRTQLGENATAFGPPASNSNYVFGANKDETELTIMLKRMMSGDWSGSDHPLVISLFNTDCRYSSW